MLMGIAIALPILRIIRLFFFVGVSMTLISFLYQLVASMKCNGIEVSEQ